MAGVIVSVSTVQTAAKLMYWIENKNLLPTINKLYIIQINEKKIQEMMAIFFLIS